MMYPPFAVFSPALAAGAAAVAVGVPLLVHLLFRKRYQVVPWAAIRFLLVAERRHKRRIDQWLLLALRTLALVLFLFAMIATTPDEQDRADMARLAAGHDAALNDLMERHATGVFHFLCRMLGNEDDANDLAQETFVQAWRGLARFRPAAPRFPRGSSASRTITGATPSDIRACAAH